MTKAEALKIIDQVLAQYRGTRQEHALLQQALEALSQPDKKYDPKEK